MGKGNAAVKQWLGNKNRYADLFNGIVFEGKKVVLPEELEPIESESDILITDKNENTKELQRHRDLIMRWKKGAFLVVLGCENQAKVHYAMPVRNMLYDGLSYTEQIKKLREQHRKNENGKMTDSEFLSGFCKSDKIYPVITIVFYYGKEPWDAGKSLYEMFPEEILESQFQVLEKYVPNYRINLVEAGNVERCELFRTDLQEIFGMLKYRKDKKELMNYLKENEYYFKNVDEDTYHVIGEFLHSDKTLKREVGRQVGEEDIDMCEALEELYNDGKVEGEKDMLQLISYMTKDGLLDMIPKLAEDEAFLEEMFTKYQIQRTTKLF